MDRLRDKKTKAGYLNNKLYPLVIHTVYEGDIITEKMHNPRYVFWKWNIGLAYSRLSRAVYYIFFVDEGFDKLILFFRFLQIYE